MATLYRRSAAFSLQGQFLRMGAILRNKSWDERNKVFILSGDYRPHFKGVDEQEYDEPQNEYIS